MDSNVGGYCMIRTANWVVKGVTDNGTNCFYDNSLSGKISVCYNGVWYPYDRVRILCDGEWIGCKSTLRFSSGNKYASLSYTKDGGTQTLNIIDNYSGSWYVSSKPSWVTVSGSNGNYEQTISITVAANTTASRSEQIQIKSTVDDVLITIDLHQDSAVVGLFLNKYSFTVSYNQGNNLYLQAGCDPWFNLGTPYIISKPDWISIAEPDVWTKRYMTFAKNTSVDSRVGDIVVGVTGGFPDTKTCTITQTGRPATVLSVTPTTARVDYSGRVYENGDANYGLGIAATSNEAWTVSKNFDWSEPIEVDMGLDTQILISQFQTNTSTSPRTGVVTITSEYGATATVTVTQDGKPSNYINVDEAYFGFDAEGLLSYNLRIDTNDSWFIYSKPSWIILEPNRGTGVTEVVVSALPTIRTTERTGTVVLKTNSGLTASINVSQDPSTGEEINI